MAGLGKLGASKSKTEDADDAAVASDDAGDNVERVDSKKGKAMKPGAFNVATIVASLKAANKDSEIIALSEDEEPPVRAFLTTGFPTLDAKLGGGWPAGRMSEVFGPEASGKSALADMAIVECTKAGGIAVVLEYEETRTKKRLVQMGAVAENIIFARPEHAEEGFAIWFGALNHLVAQVKAMDKAGKQPPVNLLVLDSIPAAMPMSEAAAIHGAKVTAKDLDAAVAGLARVLAANLRRLIKQGRRANAHTMFINQERDDFGGRSFVKLSKTPGGRAMKFYMTHRVRTSARPYPLQAGTKKTGLLCGVRVVKNKIVPPGEKTEWRLDYNVGPSPAHSALHLLQIGNVVTFSKKGLNGKRYFKVPWHDDAFLLSEWPGLMNNAKFCKEAWSAASTVEVL